MPESASRFCSTCSSRRPRAAGADRPRKSAARTTRSGARSATAGTGRPGRRTAGRTTPRRCRPSPPAVAYHALGGALRGLLEENVGPRLRPVCSLTVAGVSSAGSAPASRGVGRRQDAERLLGAAQRQLAVLELSSAVTRDAARSRSTAAGARLEPLLGVVEVRAGVSTARWFTSTAAGWRSPPGTSGRWRPRFAPRRVVDSSATCTWSRAWPTAAHRERFSTGTVTSTETSTGSAAA